MFKERSENLVRGELLREANDGNVGHSWRERLGFIWRNCQPVIADYLTEFDIDETKTVTTHEVRDMTLNKNFISGYKNDLKGLFL